MARNDKTVKRGVYLYIDGKEIKNDINSIDLEIKRLQRDIKDMTRGSEEYNRTMAKIQHLQGILKQHRQEIKGITTETKKATVSIGGMVDWFNRFGGVILSVIGFLTGFALALRSIRDERNKLEESQAGLKALTGLDDESITWLTAQAKTLSTTMTKEGLRVRQSASEILDAFMLVGSAKPELLGDKEALKQVTEEAMRLQAAAKDITLNEAVDSLTLALNQYGAAADQAGRFSNVLAAGSQVGSANIASQAKAIRTAGTAAASANIPIEHTVGLIETLAYRGIKDEVAGTGLKKFFLVLQTGADELNPKLVGLDKALENLKNKKMDAGAIKKMFGEEGFNTASVILQNTEMVNDFTKAVTGTNVAYEQAAINSNTTAAKLAQSRNQMKEAAIELGEKLNPALSVSTNMMTNVVKFLPGMIDWFQKWGSTIIALLIPVLAYISYLKMWALYQAALNKITIIATTLKIAYSVATANVSGNLSGANKILLLFSGNMSKSVAIQKAATAAAYLFAAAKALLTGNLKAARVAMIAFNSAVSTNFYVAIATAIIAIAVAVYKLATRTTEAQDAVKQFKEEMQTERDQLRRLTDAAQKAADGTQRRKELIEEINSKYGKYLTNLLNEHSSLEDIRKAYSEINRAMQQNIAQKVLDEKIEKIGRDVLDDKISQMDDVRDILSHSFLPDAQVNEITQKIDKIAQKYAATGKSAEYIAKSLNYGIKKMYFQDGYAPRDLEGQIKDYAQVVLKEYGKIQQVQKSLAAFVPGVGQTNEIPEIVITGTAPKKKVEDNGTGTLEKESEKQKRIQDAMDEIEVESLKEQAKLKEKYLAGDEMNQLEYLQFLSDLEMKTLDQKLKIAGLEPKKREEISNQILELQLKLKEKCIKEDLDEKKQFLSNQQKALDMELQEESERYRKGLITREEYLQVILKLLKKYKKEIQKTTEDATGEEKEAVDSYIDYVVKALQKGFDKTEEASKTWQEKVASNWNEMTKWSEMSSEQQSATLASLLDDIIKFCDGSTFAFETVEQKYEAVFSLMSGVAQQFGVALGKTLTGEEEAMDEFMQNLVSMVLDAVQKMLIAYIAMTTIRNVGGGGIVLGLIKAAAEIALITAAFETAKSAIGNFYTGGYTGPGNWDQPKGFVHSNEFVANRFAVSNPNLRPIFDVIDTAQRSGNVGNLTVDDVVAVSGSRSGSSNVPVLASNTTTTTTTNDPAMVAMLNECSRMLRRLKERLDKPIVSESYITGKRGINQALKDYQNLNNNKSRNKK